ncbi:hypothetical protein AAFF_G00261570 [Aldrovandia affinis]|uniref:Uncharacterized protein n=1 Tax=Aldrovandia affinis TaxID=143900 RepID=A0AAD7RBY3_9TELE|nr:hypothetical protein AAFF_G00261570 [Aldrovandia affinis]
MLLDMRSQKQRKSQMERVRPATVLWAACGASSPAAWVWACLISLSCCSWRSGACEGSPGSSWRITR